MKSSLVKTRSENLTEDKLKKVRQAKIKQIARRKSINRVVTKMELL